jgi:hypothetical protein
VRLSTDILDSPGNKQVSNNAESADAFQGMLGFAPWMAKANEIG